MAETWYVLEDGSAVDPNEVTTDDTGRLFHERGFVAMRGDVPSSRGIHKPSDIEAPPLVEKAAVAGDASEGADDQQDAGNDNIEGDETMTGEQPAQGDDAARDASDADVVPVEKAATTQDADKKPARGKGYKNREAKAD